MGAPADLPALTRAHIDLDALAHNYRELRRVASPAARMMAVVKADGYGHGAERVSRVALENGADYLAVARISEAVALRETGIAAPIVLFGFALPDYVAYLAANDIQASVDSLAAARRLSDEALRVGTTIQVHIKFDTGMGRLGLLAEPLAPFGDPGAKISRAVQAVLDIARLPGVSIEGLYTHFANADAADKSHARFQFSLFMEILEELARNGFEAPLRHAANSAAVIDMPETHLDMIRPGIAQYGLRPSAEVDMEKIDLRPVMTLASTIINVKAVPAGFKISYGSTYITPAPTRIATVPIGYADGFDRLLSSKGEMLVHGMRVPIVGRVCMDLTMIDVGRVPDAAVGDEAVVFGRQGNQRISADELAAHVGTINYEIVSSLTSRVQRVYSGFDENTG